jgi:hypothetical protein
MKSYEAIQAAVKGRTVDHAKKLGLSTSLLNKWQEPATDFADSGAYNPLDRIETIVETALALGNREGAFDPIHYLARRFNGIFLPLPLSPGGINEVTQELLKTVEKFGHLSREASRALEDGRITPRECDLIEKEAWNLVQQTVLFVQKAKEVAR